MYLLEFLALLKIGLIFVVEMVLSLMKLVCLVDSPIALRSTLLPIIRFDLLGCSCDYAKIYGSELRRF